VCGKKWCNVTIKLHREVFFKKVKKSKNLSEIQVVKINTSLKFIQYGLEVLSNLNQL